MIECKNGLCKILEYYLLGNKKYKNRGSKREWAI